ncbi:LysR family transcriptional regulator [Photobacterium profundum]|nr:LysR family transcriptional regulator [Photobacterium profundum]PSV60944.1 LysR family transcriptional regulator [Photobacterium profundum]
MKNTMDLNLYRFLDLLLEQKSQVKVCHTLNISRATFNRHLADCRDIFSNELFIATKGIYEPTLFMTQLLSIVKEPLDQLEQAQQLSQSFTGDNVNFDFVFYAPSALSTLLTVPLLQGLSSPEHHPKISMVDWSLEGVEHPKSGTLSVGISGYPNDVSERIVERKVGSLALYLYVSECHSLASNATIELTDLEHIDTVRVSMGTLDDNSYYARLKKQTGIALTQKLTVASVFSALQCVKVSPYAFVCFHIDDGMLPCGVRRHPILLNGHKMSYDVGIQYHRACYQHPVVKEIEKMIADAIESL